VEVLAVEKVSRGLIAWGSKEVFRFKLTLTNLSEVGGRNGQEKLGDWFLAAMDRRSHVGHFEEGNTSLKYMSLSTFARALVGRRRAVSGSVLLGVGR
jgi:hypothetical protein